MPNLKRFSGLYTLLELEEHGILNLFKVNKLARLDCESTVLTTITETEQMLGDFDLSSFRQVELFNRFNNHKLLKEQCS